MMDHSDHLRDEQNGVVRHSLEALVFCAFVLWAVYSQAPRWFDLPIDQDSRLDLALGSVFVVLFWVLLGVILVSTGRFFSEQDISGSAFAPPSRDIAVKTAFLHNTLEQSVLAIGIYLVSAHWLPASELALIPAAAIRFSIGRAAFRLGSLRGARGRSFGMATTMLPTMALYGIVAVRMVAGK